MASVSEAVQDSASALRLFEPSYGRMLAFGIEQGDLLEAVQGVGSIDDWVDRWQRLGEEFSQLAERSIEGSFQVSARQFWLRACSAFHFAEFKLYTDERRKQHLQQQARSSFLKAIPHLDCHAARVEVPCKSGKLPGYFYAARRLPAPCVVLINGLDSMKEVELHRFAQVFLQRGISALCFDGPGQGEALKDFPLEVDFQEAASSVADFLASLPEVDALAVFGVSFGGHLACRSAAADPRFAACISLGGFFDCKAFENGPPMVGQALTRAFGGREAVEECLPQVSLEPLRGKMDRPLLVVHGAQDTLISLSQVRSLLDWGRGDRSLVVFRTGDHVCTNRFSQCLPLMGDWLQSRLRAGGQDVRAAQPSWPAGAEVSEVRP